MTPEWYHKRVRVLAVDPTSKGFGFAVIEADLLLVDYGVARVWSARLRELIDRTYSFVEKYRPVMIILPRISSAKARERTRAKVAAVAAHLRLHHHTVVMLPRDVVLKTFEPSGTTKHEIAIAIAKAYPELTSRLPRKRRPWMSEDESMNIFDAVALALTVLSNPRHYWQKHLV
jgi:Holliday junction resolvasome RuvABC endonuclease subunit